MKSTFLSKLDHWRIWNSFHRELKDKSLFQDNLDEKRLSETFVRHIRIFELEPHNYCNRNCDFCSNILVARHKNNNCDFFPMELYDSCLHQLADMDYAGQIRFSRYSEPLYKPEMILEMISLARKICPKATTMIISNGDFLDKALLGQLAKKGLNRLHISVYLGKQQNWNQRLAEEKIDRVARKLGLKCGDLYVEKNSLSTVLYGVSMSITTNCVNYGKQGFDRGGTLTDLRDKDFKRTSPCMQIFHNFTMDYDGTVMPCCNLRGDLDQHEKFIIGHSNGSGGNLLSIYGSERFLKWRRQMAIWSMKSGPCLTCKQLTAQPWLSLLLPKKWSLK